MLAGLVTAGAAGVVLDWQLALCEESDVPDEIKARVSKMSGTETASAGHDSIGQDAVFASRLASQYRTVKGICDAISAEAMRHLRVARQHRMPDAIAPSAANTTSSAPSSTLKAAPTKAVRDGGTA